MNESTLVYGKYPPVSAINYIWANRTTHEKILPNPYTSRVRMIICRSGTRESGKWIKEKRNIVQDYQNAFGEKPPLISGIAIMTDADNTGEERVSFYGGITLSSR